MGNYVVYKLLDRITNLTYIGIDRNPEQTYLGMAETRDDLDNTTDVNRFERTNLHTCDTIKDAWKKEEKLIKRSVESEQSSLNIYLGDTGELKGVGRVSCVELHMVHRIISGDTVNPATDIV